MTPFLERISNFLILAVPEEVVMVARLPCLLSVIFEPPIEVRTVSPSFMASNLISLGTICLRRTSFKASLLSSLVFTLKNATFLGANTVNEPSPVSVSNRPAAFAVLPNLDKEKDGLTNAASRMLQKKIHISVSLLVKNKMALEIFGSKLILHLILISNKYVYLAYILVVDS